MAEPQWELVALQQGTDGGPTKSVIRMAVPGGWIYEIGNRRMVGQEVDRSHVFVPARQPAPPPKSKPKPGKE